MRILLDTNILLWAVGRSRLLDVQVRDALEDDGNEILFSAVSIWEIAIKFALRRADFTTTPEHILSAAKEVGFTEISVSSAIAATVANLPLIHRDPFDRLLVAQAIAEPAVLFTSDRRLGSYSPLVRRVARGSA